MNQNNIVYQHSAFLITDIEADKTLKLRHFSIVSILFPANPIIYRLSHFFCSTFSDGFSQDCSAAELNLWLGSLAGMGCWIRRISVSEVSLNFFWGLVLKRVDGRR